MTLFLAELARVVPAGTHAVLVLGRAGWHVSGDLVVPANLTLVHLPPYSPELNPVERVWLYLRERWLSHRVLAGYDAACAAWNALRAEPGRLRSLTAFPWLARCSHHFMRSVSHPRTPPPHGCEVRLAAGARWAAGAEAAAAHRGR